MSDSTYCGYVAIIGRPNVGKSTLLNKVIGQKVSITARKPQTTRHKILGIRSSGNYQTVYVDTPGFHKGREKALNVYMKHAIESALSEVDIVILVIEALKWREDDEWVLERIKKLSCPIILAINKADTVKDKKKLLPFIKEITTKHDFSEVMPISAKTGINIAELETVIKKLLPKSAFYFYSEQVTDRSERFLVAEIIREKLTRLLGQELPHELTVTIENFFTKNRVIHIAAVIYVEKKGQKKIIVGKGGEKLKEIGTKARLDIEKMLSSKVFLQLWVKVKHGWSDDNRALQELGYSD